MLNRLSRDELMKLVNLYARTVLTADGMWFLGVEGNYGLDAAIDLDEKVWERGGAAEARRLKNMFSLGEGLQSIIDALELSHWVGRLLKHTYPERSEKRVVMRITECPSQMARVRDGRGEFPCKTVETKYFTNFAKVIDPKVKVTCLMCPPDHHPSDVWCEWEFKL